MNPNVIRAIFRRNFLSYFSNPTGYVFIILFVALSSAAAYWPNEFFNANLANLDQLNRFLPYILLIFVPAITMGIWADERRQGTDELLLTIPATDLDVVLGKFLAGVGVFSVSLAFSALCNWAMLYLLTKGHPDLRLLLVNYLGYWLVGLAMVATGMVASFLTSNLTVSFILGVVFNIPLVAADWADAFTGSPAWSLTVKHWGLAEQFRDFGRGVISLGSTIYFLMLVVVMLYLCMVLIGRRHWLGGRDGRSMFGHYLCRAASLIVIAAALNVVAEASNVRLDATAEKVSSLSPDTEKLIAGLDMKNRPPIVMEAYISPSVPENYVQTRLNLINALHELEALRRDAIQVKIVSTEPSTEEAARAEEQFGIKPQSVMATSRGAAKDEQIFLGVAATSGLQKVVVPFFDQGTPIEYELVRSIATVAQDKRKRLGVVQTDAQLFGGFEMDMGMPSQRPRQMIIDELEKQYEVIQVDPSKPIEKFDVLLAVQPSSLGPPQMDNLVAAIQNGQPTAIFEDPLPAVMRGVPGTAEEKRGNPMMGQMPQMKGDIQKLWKLLGVEMVGGRGNPIAFGPQEPTPAVIWQDWNPYPKISQMRVPREFVFIQRTVTGNDAPFNEKDSITSGLQELWFPFPGGLKNPNSSKTKFTPLVTTGDPTGTIQPDVYKSVARRGEPPVREENDNITHELYVLAAKITGEVKSSEPPPISDDPDSKKAADTGKGATDDKGKASDAKTGDSKAGNTSKTGDVKAADAKGPDSKAAPETAKKKAAPRTNQLNVVLVADIDLMADGVFQLRSQAQDLEYGIRLDNIVFVLNVLDSLSGDERFVEIRKRRPAHRTLTAIEDVERSYKDDLVKNEKVTEGQFELEKQKVKAREASATKQEEELKKEAADLQTKIDAATAKGEDPPPDLMKQARDFETKYNDAQINRYVETQRVTTEVARIDRDSQSQEAKLQREFNTNIRSEQNFYKFLALLVPPIPPFLVAAFVYFRRRAEEREGVAKSRLR
jgi:ABC-2 type transport system permease protein